MLDQKKRHHLELGSAGSAAFPFESLASPRPPVSPSQLSPKSSQVFSTDGHGWRKQRQCPCPQRALLSWWAREQANRNKQTAGRVCIPVLKPQQLPAIRTEGGGLGSPPSLLEGLCTFGKWAPLLGLSDLTKHICDSVKGEIEEGGGMGGRQ